MQNTIIFLLLLTAIFIFVRVLSFTPPDSQIYISSGILSRTNTDIYRGWAILIVMIGHITSCWNCVVLGPLGGMGVTMFLLLSGYGLHESYKKNGLKGFWKKKLLRIALPYVLFRIIWMMVEGDMSLNRLNNIIDCANSYYWYIDYLVRCYAAFWIACSLSKWHLKWVVLIVFALYSFFALSFLCGSQALSFIAGIALSVSINKIHKTEKKRYLLISLVIFASFIGLVMLAIKHNPTIHSSEGLLHTTLLLVQNFTFAVTFIIVLYWTREWTGGQLILLLGSLSLELYIIHMCLLKPMVGGSAWQGLAMMITATLLAYSFQKLTQQIMSFKKSTNKIIR